MQAGVRGGELRSLTGLRGVAACFVVIYHYFQNDAPTGGISTIVRHGYLSVDLFFVLSGFVMALTYASQFKDRFSTRAYCGFLYKRFGRVYPLYLIVTLAGAGLIYRAGQADASLPLTLFDNLALIQAWGTADTIGGPTWSISTEFAAYLLFPALVAVTLNRRWRWAWLAAIVSVAVIVGIAHLSDAQINQIPYGDSHFRNGPLDVYAALTPYPLLRCFAGFTIGLVAFRVAGSPACRGLARFGYWTDVVMVVALLALLIPSSDAAEVVIFAPLIIGLSQERSISSRILGSRVIHWLGLISYSIYLMHVLVDHLVRSQITSALTLAHVPHAYSFSALVLLPLVLGLSACTYYGIERPARDWARKLGARRTPAIAQNASA